jgi:branched-chain amino acid transport system ATP-binding protein
VTLLLEVEDLWTGYGPITVNRQVTLSVAEREVVTIIGPNGAGKSTLLRTLAGLKRPVRGTVRLAGKVLTGLPADRVAQAGMVLVPEGRRIFADISVRDNLRLGGYCRHDRQAVEAEIAAMETLFPVLRQKRHARGGDLSGGQQQMLAIARGLMARPKILLLDEPSLGLAPIMVKEVRGLIGAIRATFGTTILLVEQNAALALAVADRGYIMQTGQIVAAGPITELRNLELMRQAYLGDARPPVGAA